MRSTRAATRNFRDARSGKLSAAERSALNQALAKAIAFRDAGKMPEAREWAAEMVRLLRSQDLLTRCSAAFMVKQIVGAKAQFRSLAEPWADSTSSTGRLMLAVLGGLADVERRATRGVTKGRHKAATPILFNDAIV